jgi:hypothetical protein
MLPISVETNQTPPQVREVSTTMSMIQRLRNRRTAARQAHAIDRALRCAPTPAMRNEILIFAQRHTS